MPFFNLTLATPTGSNDLTIFDSTVRFGGGGMLPSMGIERIAFAAEHDQAFTLKAYMSTDKGANWNLYDQRSVSAPGATTISGPFDYVVNTYTDWKLVLTNGGVDQTVWRPQVGFTEEVWP